MKQLNSIINCRLLACLITSIIAADASAGIRIGNASRSYANAYNQVNAMQQAQYYNEPVATATTPSTDIENNLPVRVADKSLAEQIASGKTDGISVTLPDLEACSLIYPNGEFAWDRPTIGLGNGGAATCVSVVKMYAYQAAPDGSDLLLAQANLSAGDSIKCNISEFPDVLIMKEAESIEFPADQEPTVDDVIAVMNEEQKQNAVLKIAAGAIIGAIGGNIAGKNDVGNDDLLGTDKGKMKGTAIGALSGAAVMAGNAYAGKVGGDIILSTGVNAAAGGLIGNIMAVGDEVLRIEDCEIDKRKTSCLWGSYIVGKPMENMKMFYNVSTTQTYVCTNENSCSEKDLINIKLSKFPNLSIEDLGEEEMNEILNNKSYQFYMAIDANGKKSIISAEEASTNKNTKQEEEGIFIEIQSANSIERQIPAMIADVRDKAFGLKQSDWREWKKNHRNGVIVYGRNTKGEPYLFEDGQKEDAINYFYPMKVEASDGGIIDLSNKARLKATLTGAGVGGALGAFSAYQGAQSDIQNRWVTAVREYKDSLQKIYCVTGKRFLGYYNDIIAIPNTSM